MKKFLSLLLALIMTMSLVTIGAGATEYKDLTDKDEIQYEEAVAVLNRIGIITGYDDGSFQPTKELTRGAAAKIIVSLLIGPEAASNLPTNYAPYPDVPAGSNFAGVISFCKTSNIISGYSDGTFKPGDSLTGHAFAKMLLGAVGYKGDVEGFTGSGWTMNVANIGNQAGLFDRLKFDGNQPVTREQACQLALNTLKATMVQYSGGVNINTASGDTMTVNPTRTYKTSNQEYAKNISNRKAGIEAGSYTDNHYTVEFGEEHFQDLRLDDEHTNKLDDFGRPSNVWSYKKVTIGTFPVAPDFTYTTQVAAKDDVKTTEATKLRALNLNGYETTTDDSKTPKTRLFVNGEDKGTLAEVADIADYTDNGTLVEVYVSDDDADFICNVVVIKTQLMEVKKIGSDYVSLDKEDDCDDKAEGYNQEPIQEEVEDVEINDKCYDFLKELKAGDKVAVVPLTTDQGKTWTVAKAYTPETVTGSLDGSKTFTASNVEDKDRGVVEVTVGGTTYKVALWNKDLNNANRDIIKVTKNDVTLLLDEYGNAMLAKDIGSTSEVMILGAWRNAVVNGVLVRLATGWDVKGNAVSLNVGAEQSSAVSGYDDAATGFEPGDVVRYTNDGVTGIAEWKLNENGIFAAPGNENAEGDEFAIKASNSAVRLGDAVKAYPLADNLVMKASGVKTIYVSFDGDEVDYIEIKSGLQNTTKKELNQTGPSCGHYAQGVVKLDGGAVTAKSEVEYVVIKQESSDATLKNLGYVYDVDTTNRRDENGDIISDYRVFTVEEESNRMLSAKTIGNQRFVRFNELDAETKLYDMRTYDRRQASTSVMRATILGIAAAKNNNLLSLDPDSYRSMANEILTDANTDEDLKYPNIHTNTKDGYGVDLTVGDKKADLINIKGAKFLDLTNNKISDADDLEYVLKGDADKGIAPKDVKVHIAFNDNPDNDEFRLTYIIVIVDLVDDKVVTETGAVSPSVEGAFTPLASAEVGKTYEITLNDGYSYLAAGNVNVSDVVVTGNKISFKVTALPATIGVSKDADMKELTLTGAWTTSGSNAVTVWNAAGTEQYEAERVTTIAGTDLVYKIPADAVVQIKDTAMDDGTYLVNDETLTVTNDIVKVTMNDDKTLDIAKLQTAALTYAITFEEGITPVKFYGDHDNEIQATQNGNVWYVKRSDNLCYFTVKTTSTQYAFAAGMATPTMAPGSNVTPAPANTGTPQKIDMSSAITTDLFVYGATKVNVKYINPACFGFAPSTDAVASINEVCYAVPSFKLNPSIDAVDDTVSCAILGTADTAADRIHSGTEVGTDEITIQGAYAITLQNAKATVDGSEVTDKFYIAYNKTCPAVNPTKGSKVIDVTNAPTGAEYTSAAVTSDMTLGGAVALTPSGLNVQYMSPEFNRLVPINTSNLVAYGTEVTVEGKQTTAGYWVKAVNADGDEVTPIASENSTAALKSMAKFTADQALTFSEVNT